jgi:hypothetical protein
MCDVQAQKCASYGDNSVHKLAWVGYMWILGRAQLKAHPDWQGLLQLETCAGATTHTCGEAVCADAFKLWRLVVDVLCMGKMAVYICLGACGPLIAVS